MILSSFLENLSWVQSLRHRGFFLLWAAGILDEASCLFLGPRIASRMRHNFLWPGPLDRNLAQDCSPDKAADALRGQTSCLTLHYQRKVKECYVPPALMEADIMPSDLSAETYRKSQQAITCSALCTLKLVNTDIMPAIMILHHSAPLADPETLRRFVCESLATFK